MRDYIEALLAGLEEEEPSEEAAELDISPAVVRLEKREEWTAEDGGEPLPAAPGMESALPSAAGVDAPAETAGRGARAEVEEGSGAEALLPGLTDTAAAARRAAGREDGPPPAGVREAAEHAGAVGGLLRRLEASGGETLAPAVSSDGGDSPAGGGRPSGAAWLAEQVGRSLRPAVEQAGRSGGGVTVLRPVERGGGTVEAEGLDRMFRRDARRYDGGFQLL